MPMCHVLKSFVIVVGLFLCRLQAQTGDCTRESPLRIGVATVLSGDFASLGENIRMSAETFKKNYARHPYEFIFEDSKLGSADGLHAFQRLINVERVNLLIAGSSTNGTLAAAPLINSSKTVAISVVTGGNSIDRAGEYIFRLSNSDILNGKNQARRLVSAGVESLGILTEQTEYTQDVSGALREEFAKGKGRVVFDESFDPGTSDFRPLLGKLMRHQPRALFVSTQTGSALALVLRQLAEMNLLKGLEIHTTFVAAANPDAVKLGGGLMKGVKYMAPAYAKENPFFKEFVEHYHMAFGKDPSIAFHTAALLDALSILDQYLDARNCVFKTEDFKRYLSQELGRFSGAMGEFSLDREGNADLGFEAAELTSTQGTAR